MATLSSLIQEDKRGVLMNLSLGICIPCLAGLAYYVASLFGQPPQAAISLAGTSAVVLFYPMNAAANRLSGPLPERHSFATRVLPMLVTLPPATAVLLVLISVE